ncbi:NADH:flavin oxidoreductase/NADH oxidase [Roseomonas hellenica]|uniref:NADH:flavin oxidoreductase/NADH oxidase n=1 Tax=Plastoroseomonas hellenica TaxID=2687306 RepID=A0ABS5EZE5_9PROT|nr:NADH:flavin oxidoreductase/NADH oxidase [Plastoroseomonas hellenica]MBR0665676.1 NADH:flavin oxidoreductase/NADH oxidase [Plastoroseomonas hellenica]
MLFTPFTLRGITFRNRVIISPMCQYSAKDGIADDWHLVHLGRFALGGAGAVVAEATAVLPEGRITHGDLGIWSEAHVAPLARVATFLKQQGAVPGIQIGHAGRKASMQRPWYGNGPLNDADIARGDRPWETVSASAIPIGEGWITPRAMTAADIAALVEAFVTAAGRAAAAGFELLELHGAHGYLLHQFLSPISNHRDDAYGGARENRWRLPLEIATAVRAVWPTNLPLSFRVSSVDGAEGGNSIEDTIAFAQALKAGGVDVVDCSSGGIAGSATAARVTRDYGFQVPFAARIRHEAGLPTMAVGLITDPRHAEAILQAGDADLIAIAREALADPNWAVHAEATLGAADPEARFATWPKQAGWWLNVRQREIDRLGPWKA